MTAQVIRFRDYERTSREPDAVDRDPTDSAIIIILPTIRVEQHVELPGGRRRRRGRKLEREESR